MPLENLPATMLLHAILLVAMHVVSPACMVSQGHAAENSGALLRHIVVCNLRASVYCISHIAQVGANGQVPRWQGTQTALPRRVNDGGRVHQFVAADS
eukprot:5977990-Amphidinium_carterae.1